MKYENKINPQETEKKKRKKKMRIKTNRLKYATEDMALKKPKDSFFFFFLLKRKYNK